MSSAFTEGQEVAVLFRGQIHHFSKVTKVTHGGKRVHVHSWNSVFNADGSPKDGSAARIVPATDEHRRALANLQERTALWNEVDKTIAAESYDRRATARARVSTETLRQIVALLVPQ